MGSVGQVWWVPLCPRQPEALASVLTGHAHDRAPCETESSGRAALSFLDVCGLESWAQRAGCGEGGESLRQGTECRHLLCSVFCWLLPSLTHGRGLSSRRHVSGTPAILAHGREAVVWAQHRSHSSQRL